jgi:hypothetical protein
MQELRKMTKDEALRLALEALESGDKLINGDDYKMGLHGCIDGYYGVCFDIPNHNKQTNKAITAIKSALEAKDEPVAWPFLIAAQRKPLTKELIEKIFQESAGADEGTVERFARGIEFAHGIKENT